MSDRPFLVFSREQFTRMWLDGDKLETIAHAFNCSLTTVSDRARRFDLPARQRGGRRRVVDYTGIAPTIELRWEQGIPVRAIARELHVSVRTITRLTRHLTPRPRGRSKRPASSAVSAS